MRGEKKKKIIPLTEIPKLFLAHNTHLPSYSPGKDLLVDTGLLAADTTHCSRQCNRMSLSKWRPFFINCPPYTARCSGPSSVLRFKESLCGPLYGHKAGSKCN